MVKQHPCLRGEFAAHWEKPQSSGLHLNQHMVLSGALGPVSELHVYRGNKFYPQTYVCCFRTCTGCLQKCQGTRKRCERIQAILIEIPNVQPWVRHLCLNFDGIQGQKQRRAINQWGWQGVTFILLGGSEMKTAHVIGRHSKRHCSNALAKLLLEVSEGAKDGNN